MHAGGNYNQNQNHGLFYANGNNAASNSNGNVGSRRLVLGLATRSLSGADRNGWNGRTALAEDMPMGHGLVHPKGRWKYREATRRRTSHETSEKPI